MQHWGPGDETSGELTMFPARRALRSSRFPPAQGAAVTSALLMTVPSFLGFPLLMLATALVALTRDPLIVGFWVLVCAFALGFGRSWKAGRPLLFWIGFLFFYPLTSVAYTSLQQPATMVGGMFVWMGLASRGAAAFAWRRSSWFKFTVVLWMTWGLVAYLPVLFVWAGGSMGLTLPGLDGISAPTSALKTAVPILAAWAVAAAAVRAIATPVDVTRLIRALKWGVVVLTLLAFAQAATGGMWIDSEYPLTVGRLKGVTEQDANGYGRTLLIPILVLFAALMTGRTLGPVLRGAWVALGLAIVSLGLTLSRTSYVSLTVGLLTIVGFSLGRKRNIWMVLVLGAIVVGAAYGLGLSDAFAPGMERADRGNWDGRLDIYTNLWGVVVAHPWVGMRPGGYIAALEQTAYTGIMVSAHNTYLMLAVEWGLPMTAALVVALMGAVWNGWAGLRLARRYRGTAGAEQLRALSLGAIALAMASLVFGIADAAPPEYVFLAFGLALAARYQVGAALAAASAPPRTSVDARGRRVPYFSAITLSAPAALRRSSK